MYSLQGGVEKVAQEDRPGVRTEQKVKGKRMAGPALIRVLLSHTYTWPGKDARKFTHVPTPLTHTDPTR